MYGGRKEHDRIYDRDRRRLDFFWCTYPHQAGSQENRSTYFDSADSWLLILSHLLVWFAKLTRIYFEASDSIRFVSVPPRVSQLSDVFNNSCRPFLSDCFRTVRLDDFVLRSCEADCWWGFSGVVNSVDPLVHPSSLLFWWSQSPTRVTTKSPDRSPSTIFYSKALLVYSRICSVYPWWSPNFPCVISTVAVDGFDCWADVVFPVDASVLSSGSGSISTRSIVFSDLPLPAPATTWYWRRGLI
jgi:hypothetical protein